VISPFGTVRFRDFFFADVITSMGQSLKDIGAIMVFFGCNVNGKDDDKDSECMTKSWIAANFKPNFLIVCSFIPFWFRFWQCINKQWHLGFRHENNT
jgi:hypothetical protein